MKSPENAVPDKSQLHKAQVLHSDLVGVDPDGLLQLCVEEKIKALLRQYDNIFSPTFKGYNGAVGALEAKVNMGPVQPPQRKGRIPQYSKTQLVTLQEKGLKYCVVSTLFCGVRGICEVYNGDAWIRDGVRGTYLPCTCARPPTTKTIIAHKQATILCWLLEFGSIRASPNRIATLSICQSPKTTRALRSLVGAYKLLSCVIKKSSGLLSLLENAVAVCESKDTILWTEELNSAFSSAQNALSTCRSIALPLPTDQLWIVTDGALKTCGLRVTLYVIRNDNLLLARFFSAKLRQTLRQWLPCEIEAISIAASIKHFSPYIIQSSSTACVLTDSKPYVQAFELCRGEFSSSTLVSTFLSTASRYQVFIRHVSDLRRTVAHLRQGTRPSKKLTNIKDIKRYLNVASLVNDGLLVVKRNLPFAPCRELIIVPRQTPKVRKEQNSTNPPETIGSSFAADVLKRERQLVFVLRECVTSYTFTKLFDSERHQDLRDAIIQLLAEVHPLNGPIAVFRTDPASGFKTLVKDELLARQRITIELGRPKNVNKNSVAEKAIQELEDEILCSNPSSPILKPVMLSLVTARLNTRIQNRGLSAREMWTQRDQFSNKQIPLTDQNLIIAQHERRSKNHSHSERKKCP
ncbi:unnamed protein product [Mytilus coruscus]|uniref:Integrase catalytic domain-containing protein n=1 Tax=Mytilus coruscus TaxID=42192 RepID=A0A6J8BA62_MYTCO|nr:unnamed protein product [Mytilus coruscus]